MPPRKPTPNNLEADLSALNAAADTPGEALPHLRAALTHRSNLIVSRAARHIARLDLRTLQPELIEAFHRFLRDPIKSDPQCWAKNDIAKALAAFDAQQPELFLIGLRHQQFEPTWGGSTDTAGPLRGTCALALVPCRELASPVLLRHLLPLFGDKELPVRVNAARAIEQVGSESAALLLRLRAELGSDEPELLGACISGVLHLDGDPALPWVAGFLQHHDDLFAEAAFALAEHRSPAALTHLQQAFTAQDFHDRDPRSRDLRVTLLRAAAAMRLPESTTWLLSLVSSGSLDARTAAQALCESSPSPELQKQLADLHFPCKKS